MMRREGAGGFLFNGEGGPHAKKNRTIRDRRKRRRGGKSEGRGIQPPGRTLHSKGVKKKKKKKGLEHGKKTKRKKKKNMRPPDL